MATAPARFRAARLEARPVGHGHRAILGGGVVAAVVDEADGVAVGHGRRRTEVAPAQRHAIEAVAARRQVDQRSMTKIISGRPAARYGVVGAWS
jgi:hypothetical protein